MDGLDEEVVEGERGRDRRDQGDEQAADDCDGDDHQQVEQDLTLQRKGAARTVQEQSQQRECQEGEGQAGELSTPSETPDRGARGAAWLREQILGTNVGE